MYCESGVTGHGLSFASPMGMFSSTQDTAGGGRAGTVEMVFNRVVAVHIDDDAITDGKLAAQHHHGAPHRAPDACGRARDRQ